MPSKRCIHDRYKNLCRDCGGTAFCIHDRQKNKCRDCGGKAFCMHDREKCRDCNSKAFCIHERRKNDCRDCGGTFCQHSKRRQVCEECNNCLCDIPDCPLSGHRFAGAQTLLVHMRRAHSDDRKAVTKTKELDVYQALQKAGYVSEYQKHVAFAGCGLESETRCAYVDFAIPMPWGYVLVEVDEDQHRSYDVSCDVRRDFDVAASISLGSGHKLRTIRYNPDSFRVGGVTRRTSKAERLEVLMHTIDAEEPAGFERIFLFYDRESDGAKLPQVASSWDVVALHVSRSGDC